MRKEVVVLDKLLLVFNNPILIVAISSWAIGQVLKFIINLIITKKWDFARLIGDGGMPSCHSATVTSMALMTGLTHGFDSGLFGVAFVFAIIVMHDAMGVRLETGKQAKLLNEIKETLSHLEALAARFDEERLKEFVGHTPLQVLFGFLLGIAVAVVYYNFM